MATNNRLFWAVEAIGLAADGATAYTKAHGVQSVGITTSFNLDPVIELSQVAIYQQIEEVPDVEVTVEKVLDGYPPIYTLATRGRVNTDMISRSNRSAIMAMSLFSDDQVSASGTPVAQVTMSGLFVSSVGYTFPVDGNCTESVTMIGNHREWALPANTTFSGVFDNTDVPLAQTYGSGGVQRRQHVLFNADGIVTLDANNQVNASNAAKCTILPPDVAGITSSGTNQWNGQKYSAAIQRINVQADMGRDKLLELGHKSPYFRFLTLPVTVTTEIEVINKSGDWINAKETGPYTNGFNTRQSTIKIATQDGLFIDLGTRNRLSNISVGGGDTSGANSTLTYTYTTLNEFTVSHDQDPG